MCGNQANQNPTACLISFRDSASPGPSAEMGGGHLPAADEW
jgi:hypothetical protein